MRRCRRPPSGRGAFWCALLPGCSTSCPGPPAPPGMVADHIWAMSHGVVELFGRGRPGSRSPISPADMLESGALIYLRGLGVIPD